MKMHVIWGLAQSASMQETATLINKSMTLEI